MERLAVDGERKRRERWDKKKTDGEKEEERDGAPNEDGENIGRCDGGP